VVKFAGNPKPVEMQKALFLDPQLAGDNSMWYNM
jgi:hypothetical protein